MTLAELQELLRELNQEYQSKGPNVESKCSRLRDALRSSSKLTVILAKDYGTRDGLNEYVIADDEELDVPNEGEQQG